jgi:hypothetical protein
LSEEEKGAVGKIFPCWQNFDLSSLFLSLPLPLLIRKLLKKTKMMLNAHNS